MRAAGLLILAMILTSCSGAKAPVSDDPDKNAARGHAFLQTARETGDPSWYTKSEPFFEEALKSDPEHVEALIGKASLAMSRHRFLEGLQMAQRAAALNKYSAAARGILADAYVQIGDFDNAVRVLDEMVRLKPNLSSYSRIANIREVKGDLKGAVHAMEMAIQAGAPNAENTAWCIVQLGNLYAKMSRPREAEIAFRGALRRFPEYAHAYAGLARLAAARNDHNAAVDYYKKAIDRLAEPGFLIELAAIYQTVGKTDDVKAQLARVAEVKKIYEKNGVTMMDREIAELMSAAGILQTGS